MPPRSHNAALQSAAPDSHRLALCLHLPVHTSLFSSHAAWHAPPLPGSTKTPTDNQLSFLPEALGGLTRLTSLRASNNSLVELPDSVVELSGLRTLDLRSVSASLGVVCVCVSVFVNMCWSLRPCVTTRATRAPLACLVQPPLPLARLHPPTQTSLPLSLLPSPPSHLPACCNCLHTHTHSGKKQPEPAQGSATSPDRADQPAAARPVCLLVTQPAQ